MRQAYVPIEERFRREKKHLVVSMAQARRDKGAASAYVYHGDNQATRDLLAHLQVYAMVRTEDGAAPSLQQVDYFLPDVMRAERRNAEELGFVKIGTIADHYHDVLGLCGDAIDDVIAPFAADSLIVACYGRLHPVRHDDLGLCEQAWWHRNVPTLTDAKAEITQHMNLCDDVLDRLYRRFVDIHAPRLGVA